MPNVTIDRDTALTLIDALNDLIYILNQSIETETSAKKIDQFTKLREEYSAAMDKLEEAM